MYTYIYSTVPLHVGIHINCLEVSSSYDNDNIDTARSKGKIVMTTLKSY